MSDPDYVTVRRRADTDFAVLSGDLVSEEPHGEEPHGYDLSLARSLALEGLTTPITVRPLPDGRFQVVDGLKRIVAIRLLVRLNKMAYDALRGLMRPSRRVFVLIRCRLQPPPTRAGETTPRRPRS